MASFKEAVETEAHAEFSETEGSETSQEQEGEEGTTVHAGKRARITETRMRADGEVEITANGHFVISKIAAGLHSGGKFVGGHNGYWDSLSDLLDAVTGDAPSNVHLGRLVPPETDQEDRHRDGRAAAGLLGAAPLQGQVRGPDHQELHCGRLLSGGRAMMMPMPMSPDGVLLFGIVLGLIVGLLVAVVFKKGS